MRVLGFVFLALLFFLSTCSLHSSPEKRINKKLALKERVNNCRSYIQKNQMEEALKCVSILIIDYPKAPESYNLRAYVYGLKGEYGLALKDINRAISMDPGTANHYLIRGMIHFRTGNFNRALEDFSKSIELNPKEPDAYEGRALTYWLQNRYQEAFSDINTFIKMRPKVSNGYQCRAMIYYVTKRMEEALSDCYTAVALDAKNDSAYHLIAIIYHMRGELDKAIKEYSRVIELNPKNSVPHYQRSLAYWLQGKRKSAIESLKKAIKIFPKSYHAYYHLAYFMHLENNKDKAKSYFLRARELNPKLLQEMGKDVEFASAPQVRNFFTKELAVARDYLSSSERSLTSGETRLEVKEIYTDPVRIRTGEKFVIVIEYVVADPTINSEKLPVYMNFRIIEGEKVVFKSGSILLESKNGVESIRSQNMNPTKRKGTFKLEVTLTYKNKTSIKTITFNIS